MARVGEGDERWLVQDRADGKNVGNWHWTEKSLFPWAKQQIEKTFTDYPIFEDDSVKVWFSHVDSIKGEIFVNNRKGKTLYIWDVNLYLRWKAIVKGEEGPTHEAGGRVECTDINVTDDDFETKYTIETGDDAKGRELLAIVKSKAVDIVKQEWKAMTKLMAEEHANACKVGVSQSNGVATTSPQSTPPVASTTPTHSNAAPSTTKSTMSSNGELGMRDISQVVKFYTSSSQMFETLVDPNRVSAFTGSPAQISADKGSAFKMFGGSVHGTILDTIPGKRIAQQWRFASWPADHYSQVTIEIEDKGGSKCFVKLTQTGVPEADYERTRSGWEEHFWRRIKGVFGWSYKMKQ